MQHAYLSPIKHQNLESRTKKSIKSEHTCAKNRKKLKMATAPEKLCGQVLKLVRPGDAVLVKGSNSMGMEKLMDRIYENLKQR